MPKKRFRAEQIVVLLLQIEVLIVITYSMSKFASFSPMALNTLES